MLRMLLRVNWALVVVDEADQVMRTDARQRPSACTGIDRRAFWRSAARCR